MQLSALLPPVSAERWIEQVREEEIVGDRVITRQTEPLAGPERVLCEALSI